MSTPIQPRITPNSIMRQRALRRQLIQALIAAAILLALFLTRPADVPFGSNPLGAPRPSYATLTWFSQ